MLIHHEHRGEGVRFNLDGIVLDRSTFKNVGVAFALTLVFAVVELVGGIFSNSTAIISNAIHAVGDSLTLAMAWIFERLALRQPNMDYSFGYRRLSLLSALVSGIIILVASIGVLWYIIPDLIGVDFFPGTDTGGHERHGHDHSPNSVGMFLLALLGIVVNIWAAIVLSKGLTVNEKMLTWRMIAHTLSWVSILVGAVVLMFFDIPLLDPILSVFIITFILHAVIFNLWESIKLFLQAVPCNISIEELCAEIKERVTGIIDLHDVRIWSLDGTSHVFSSHIVVAKDTNVAQTASIKKGIKEIVTELGVGQFYTTIEFESEDEICLAKVWGKT